MDVSVFILKDFPIVDKNETLYHAYKIMEKYDMDKMVVYEHAMLPNGREEKRIAGIVTSRDIVFKLATERTRLATPSSLHVSSFMSTPVTTIEPSFSLSNVLEIMVKKGYGILPVVSGNEIIGVLLRDSILKLLTEDDTEVKMAMDTGYSVAKTSDRVLKIRDIMLRKDLSFLPVVDENGDLVGYITISDVANAIFKFQDIVPAKFRKERIMHLLVEDVMRFRPPRLRITDTIATAVSDILEKKSRGAVIVDEIGDIAGVITVHNLVKYLYEKMEMERKQGSSILR